ncbi:hypothetical protein [uncultured Methanobrevibacter sp.]|nr:hypothetical protein [uncultured Methanobrevibacter sp.]
MLFLGVAVTFLVLAFTLKVFLAAVITGFALETVTLAVASDGT